MTKVGSHHRSGSARSVCAGSRTAPVSATSSSTSVNRLERVRQADRDACFDEHTLTLHERRQEAEMRLQRVTAITGNEREARVHIWLLAEALNVALEHPVTGGQRAEHASLTVKPRYVHE